MSLIPIINRANQIRNTPLASVPTYDVDFQAWIDYCTLQGYYLPDETKLDVANQYVLNLKNSGTWQNKDTHHLFYWNDLNMDQASLVCLKRRVKAVMYGGCTYTLEGWKGNGVDGYIDLSYNPFTDGVNYTETDASYMFNHNSSGLNYKRSFIGHLNTSYSNAYYRTASTVNPRLNSVGNYSPNIPFDGYGFKSVSLDVDTLSVRLNDDYYNRSVDTQPLVDESFKIFKVYDGSYATTTFHLVSIGGKTTDLDYENDKLNFNNYISTL